MSTKAFVRYAPRKFIVGSSGSNMLLAPSITETKPILMTELRHLGYNAITLDSVMSLFNAKNIMLGSNLIVPIDTASLYRIREYDRDIFENNTNGKKTKEEFEAQSKRIAREGKITNFVEVTVRRKSTGSTALLTEGNHRVVLALRHKIKRVPVMFFYTG